MKLYLFYKKIEGLEPSLYAYTDDKDLYKEFKKDRDMNIFEVKKLEVTEEQFLFYENKYRGYVLGRRGYQTSPSSSNSLQKRDHVFIVSTYKEEMDTYMKSDDITSFLYKYTNSLSFDVNEELMNALNTLGYYKVMKMGNSDSLPFLEGVFPTLNYNLSINDLFKEIKPDMLFIFVKLFGYTMKKG